MVAAILDFGGLQCTKNATLTIFEAYDIFVQNKVSFCFYQK